MHFYQIPTNTVVVVVTYRHVQYYAMIGGPSTLRDCGTPKSRDDDVIVEYSTNAGKAAGIVMCSLKGLSIYLSTTCIRSLDVIIVITNDVSYTH